MKLEVLENKNILILGLGLTGYETAISFEEYKNNIVIADKNLKGKFYEELLSKKFRIISEEEAMSYDFDIIIKSPGISFENKILEKFSNKKILNDIELAYLYIKENNLKTKIIAVTGTNGKTSTCLYIKNYLKNANFKVKSAGNIGVSPLKVLNKHNNLDFLVLELSSFQLKHIEEFRAEFAIILNISPDHLEMHKTMSDYVECKKNIFKNSKEDDYLFIKPKVFDNYLKDLEIIPKVITNNIDEDIKEKIESFKCVGMNFNNLLLIYKLGEILKIKESVFYNTLKEFKSFDNRIEFINEIKGVCYYNDSKSTNLASLKESVSKFTNIILLVGGKKTNDDLSGFDEYLNNVKSVICYGENRFEFESDKIIKRVETIDLALNEAKKISKKGDVILLSPASKSFDQFKNYEQRGNYFKKIVKETNQ